MARMPWGNHRDRVDGQVSSRLRLPVPMRGTLRKIKNTAVADQATYRRLPARIIRGCDYPINFRHDTRPYPGARRARDSTDRAIGGAQGGSLPRHRREERTPYAGARADAPGWVCAVEADRESADRLTRRPRHHPYIKSRIGVSKQRSATSSARRRSITWRSRAGSSPLSLALRVPQRRICQIIGGRRAITADSALRLGVFRERRGILAPSAGLLRDS